jgi:hypothetical protein
VNGGAGGVSIDLRTVAVAGIALTPTYILIMSILGTIKEPDQPASYPQLEQILYNMSAAEVLAPRAKK